MHTRSSTHQVHGITILTIALLLFFFVHTSSRCWCVQCWSRYSIYHTFPIESINYKPTICYAMLSEFAICVNRTILRFTLSASITRCAFKRRTFDLHQYLTPISFMFRKLRQQCNILSEACSKFPSTLDFLVFLVFCSQSFEFFSQNFSLGVLNQVLDHNF